jgi:hypothetical protein
MILSREINKRVIKNKKKLFICVDGKQFICDEENKMLYIYIYIYIYIYEFQRVVDNLLEA